MSKRFGSYMTVGGQTRTERSKRYLFSGFLACGVCGSNMVIVSGNGRRGYVKYGCPSHRYRGVCANSVMIRQDRLEDQLLAGLTERVLRPEMLEYTFLRFSEELQRRLRQIQEESARAASGVNLLQERRRELKTKADNLAEAIAAMGHSPTLLSQLATMETQIARIDQDLAEINTPRDLEVTMADLRKFVTEKALDLQKGSCGPT